MHTLFKYSKVALALHEPIVASIGPFAMLGCEPRQVRKEATVTADACAEVWLVLATMGFLHFVMPTPILNAMGDQLRFFPPGASESFAFAQHIKYVVCKRNS